MDRRLLLALTALGYVTVNSVASLSAWSRVNRFEKPARPPKTVSVVVVGWREPGWLLEVSLSSLKRQNVVEAYPQFFDFVFVGCEGVDLSIPRRYGFRVFCALRGKLRARHVGVQHSLGEIVVAADADTYYPPNWLNLMLQPFHDPGVVGVSAPKWLGVFEPVAHLVSVAFYSSRMSGRASAFTKEAYFKIGGFNLAVDDLYIKTGDVSILVAEEEVWFYERLRRLGKVVFVDAPVIHLGWRRSRGLYPYQVTRWGLQL